jgi:hypothetical protein
MGWKEIEEMLAAEWKSDTDGEITSLPAADDPLDDGDASEALAGEEDFAESDAIGDDPLRHPLVAELLERSTRLMKLAEDRHDSDLEEMVSGFMIVGPKVAGALGSVISGWDEKLNGLAVAKLKRAMGELSRALNAASRLKRRNVEVPFSIDEWVAEMLKVREELLILMDKFRGKRE